MKHFAPLTPAPKIHVISRAFAGGQMQRMTILLDGEIYTVNDYLLAALRRGVSPEELELEPEQIDDDSEYEASEAATLARHVASFSRPSGY